MNKVDIDTIDGVIAFYEGGFHLLHSLTVVLRSDGRYNEFC